MPKYYCDYCDLYLTSDLISVRKTHCYGRKHKDNVRLYYQKWLEEQGQHLIDVTIAAFNARQVAVPSNRMVVPSLEVSQIGGPHGYAIPLPPYSGLMVTNPAVTPRLGPMMMGPYPPIFPMMGMQPEPSVSRGVNWFY